MKKLLLVLFFVLAIFIAGISVLNKTHPKKPILEVVKQSDLPPQEGLPDTVETKRQAIYDAVLTRDYKTLAAQASPNFHYSFGGEYEGGFEGYLRLAETTEKESVFDIIPTLLQLPYAFKANQSSEGIYTWPSVFTKEPSEWTEEDLVMMRTFLTEEQIKSYREFGGYMYYRLGITEDGEWIFYLAGD